MGDVFTLAAKQDSKNYEYYNMSCTECGFPNFRFVVMQNLDDPEESPLVVLACCGCGTASVEGVYVNDGIGANDH